jgi:hypothetical protein
VEWLKYLAANHRILAMTGERAGHPAGQRHDVASLRWKPSAVGALGAHAPIRSTFLDDRLILFVPDFPYLSSCGLPPQRPFPLDS